MAKISSVDISIKISSTQGGAADQDISNQVLSWNGLPVEALTEEAHGYGHAWVFSQAVGMRSMGDISLQVFTDTTAGTAYALLNAAQAANEHRKIRITLGSGGPYKEADVWIAANNTAAERGALVKSEFTLRLASTVTEG